MMGRCIELSFDDATNIKYLLLLRREYLGKMIVETTMTGSETLDYWRSELKKCDLLSNSISMAIVTARATRSETENTAGVTP